MLSTGASDRGAGLAGRRSGTRIRASATPASATAAAASQRIRYRVASLPAGAGATEGTGMRRSGCRSGRNQPRTPLR